MDYNVQTKVSFRLDFDGSGEFNTLLLPDVQKQFAQHVKKVYEQDSTLGDGYVSSDLNFHFDGRLVKLEYTFSCHDENAAEAESFSAYCVRCVQKKTGGIWLQGRENRLQSRGSGHDMAGPAGGRDIRSQGQYAKAASGRG